MASEAYDEANARRYADPSMRLPDGAHCEDCRHFSYCARLISAKPYWVTCDWAPSRFSQRAETSEGAGQ